MSIKICLSNFKSHKSIDINLPYTGMVKISAPSGAGKSNVFKAINWALFGRMTNVVRYGQENCAVMVNRLAEMDIKRTKGPNLLTVGALRNEDAQKQIETTLGMTQVEFETSSYVMQDQKNSLLSLTPNEQLALIHSLSFRNSDPAEVKQRIKDKIDEFYSFLRKHELEVSLTSREQEMIEKEIAALSSNLLDLDDNEEVLKEELKTAISEKDETRIQMSHLEEESEKLKNLMNSPIRKKYKEALDKVSSTKDKIEEINKWLENNQPTSSITIKNLNDSLGEVRGRQIELKEQQRKYLDIVEATQNTKALKEKFQASESNISNISKKLSQEVKQELVSEIHTESEIYLSTVEAMQWAEGSLDSSIEDKSKEIELMETELKSLQQSIEVENMKRLSILSKEKALEEAALSLNGYKSVLSMDYVYTEDSDLLAQIYEISRVHSELSTKWSKLIGKISAINRDLGAINMNKNIEFSLKEAKERLGEAKERQENATYARDYAVEKIEKLNSLLESANKASLVSIENTIEEINLNADFWVKTMFEDTLKVTLETSKELKSKKATVDKMNLSVIENGTKIDKKEDLSGGQQSRLCLAFQLALSEMYKSPILMLDEAFKGVDLETMQTCLNAVKMLAEKKLVLVIEHFAPDEFFDEVIEIDINQDIR